MAHFLSFSLFLSLWRSALCLALSGWVVPRWQRACVLSGACRASPPPGPTTRFYSSLQYSLYFSTSSSSFPSPLFSSPCGPTPPSTHRLCVCHIYSLTSQKSLWVTRISTESSFSFLDFVHEPVGDDGGDAGRVKSVLLELSFSYSSSLRHALLSVRAAINR